MAKRVLGSRFYHTIFTNMITGERTVDLTCAEPSNTGELQSRRIPREAAPAA